jgi:class 3 adenylate cyclase/tetratricopeptide (TPR) repeat protein
MTFEAVLAQVIEALQREQRISYRTLKRRFALDDAYLDDVKEELIYAKQLARDEDNRVLVWRQEGTATPLPSVAPATKPAATSLIYTPKHLSEKILADRATLEGERKQVSVLFADLKGSTELIQGLDPEAAQQLLDPALQHMMDAVHRFEGTVNQVLGDGIMALFGAPIAHEDHALRACYAALAMQAAMRAYTAEVRHRQGIELLMRLGLNSGEVVVRAIGNDLHMDYSAVGETTHLAARMEQLALPGTIRLTAATLRLVEGLVQVKALGTVPVKGVTTPVEVFELVGVSGTRRRLQAAVARGLTRFVGRQQELDVLHQAIERAGAGHGQVVAVVGEAGVGKSRLVYECVHSHRIQGWQVLEGASVSYGKATAYFPVIDLLRRYVHLDDHDDTRTIRARLTGQLLTLDEAMHQTVPPLLALLDALPADSPFLTLDPPQRRQRTLDALKRLLLRESQVQPLLLIFEDLHWIDSETQALLDSLIESLPTTRVLLLVNYRPEYHHGWGGKTYYTQLRLDPLPPASAEAVLDALLGDDVGAQHAVPLQTLKQLLITRTEGNPFFLEESVRTLVETGVLVGAPGAYRLGRSVDSLQIPATVQAVLAARLDRLTPENKRLLQTAAVIGHEVPLLLLQATAELPEADVQRGLARLQAAEFLYETRLFPEREFTFKHALTHEVPYGSLLLERRRVLHTRIVEGLETLAGDRLTEQVERLMHHAVRGEVWDKALRYCRQADTKATERSALQEAAMAFEQALVALQHLPDRRDTCEQAIDLRFDLRNVLVPLGEYGRLLAQLRQAEPLAEALGDLRRQGQLAGYTAFCLRQLGDSDGALASAQRALALATAQGEVGLQVAANDALGGVYFWALNDYQRAAEVFRRNVETLHGAPLRERFGTVAVQAVFCRAFLAMCLAELCAFAKGQVHGDGALRLAEAVEHPYSLAWAYVAVGHLTLCQGALPQAIRVLERGLARGEAAQLSLMMRHCQARLGTAYALSGGTTEALLLLEQTMAHHPAHAVWRGEGYVLAGRPEAARPLGQQALATAQTHTQQGFQAYALRLLGNVAAQSEPPDITQAEAHYHQALTLPTDAGTRPLQAHCHHGLGTLYATTGQREHTRTALTTAITMYRAMEMTFWLSQVEAALARLGDG